MADPDALAVVNYTGGTTGRPKGAARRHGAAQAMTVAILADSELRAAPRYLAVAPNSHVGGTLTGSCGVPSSLCSVRIVDDEGADVDVGEAGEIAVRGAAAMEGCLNQPDPGEHGWIRTGDVARMDERGYLFIQDRKKDMIISGGFNVYPRVVEDALTSHPEVAEAAVFASPTTAGARRSPPRPCCATARRPRSACGSR